MNKADLGEQILEKIFGLLYSWKPPIFIDSPSPQNPKVFELFESRRNLILSNARNDLAILTHEELTEIGKEIFVKFLALSTIPNKKIASYQTAVGSLVLPLWWAGGFGVKLYRAEFQYWAQMSTWNLEQATALSIGFDPKYSIVKPEGIDFFHIAPHDFFIRRRSLIENRFYSDAGHILHEPPTPLQFCEWALSIKLDVLPELYNEVGKITGTVFEPYQLPSTKKPVIDTLEPRERESLLKMVIGLAIGGYGYNPDAQRSKIPKEIRGDLNQQGLDLHEDTIRQYLREAASILPEDTKTE